MVWTPGWMQTLFVLWLMGMSFYTSKVNEPVYKITVKKSSQRERDQKRGASIPKPKRNGPFLGYDLCAASCILLC